MAYQMDFVLVVFIKGIFITCKRHISHKIFFALVFQPQVMRYIGQCRGADGIYDNQGGKSDRENEEVSDEQGGRYRDG